MGRVHRIDGFGRFHRGSVDLLDGRLRFRSHVRDASDMASDSLAVFA